MKFSVLVESLIESSRCLGVAQAKKDAEAIDFWKSEVDKYSRAIKNTPPSDLEYKNNKYI